QAGTDAAEKIKTNLPKIQKVLDLNHQQANLSIEQLKTHSTHSLTQLRAQALNTLSQIELSGHQAILQASTAAQANVRTEAAQANTAMDQAKTHVFASGDKSVARLREEIKDREGVDAKMIIGRLKHGYKVA